GDANQIAHGVGAVNGKQLGSGEHRKRACLRANRAKLSEQSSQRHRANTDDILQ
ncbi:unnamed protein product, partial [Prorocentrum cordatum]